MKKISLFIALSLIASLTTSCASTTTIRSDPGAKLYIDGEYVGETPYQYTSTKIVGSSSQLMLKKEGFKTGNYTIRRDAQLNVGALVGGIFVLIPFLWIMDYNPGYNYELEPINVAKHK